MSRDSSAILLDDLVARTTGPQPWRKVFHAFNAIVIAVALTAVPSRTVVLGALVVIATALVAADVARLLEPRANRLFFRFFRPLASPREVRSMASSTWYMLGILVAVALCPRVEAVSGVLVLGLADPVAGYLGQRFGRRPFLGGTVEGSIVFLVVSVLVLGLRHPPVVALPVGVLAMIAERRSWPLDDNFTIPVVTAGGATLLAALG